MTIITLPGHNPGPYTGRGTNTYLVTGAVPTLIDAAEGDARHLDALARALGASSLAKVLVTHAHADHVRGASAIAARYPGAVFARVPWPDRGRGSGNEWGVEWRWLRDGDRISAGDGELRVIATPGHSPDHCAFFEERGGTVFSGDLIIPGGSVVIPVSRGGDLIAYLASLHRLLDLAPARLLPSHGPPVPHAADTIREHLAHRALRDRQVLDALASGCRSVDAIAARVYPDLFADGPAKAGRHHPAEAGRHNPLADGARENVRAHLMKLKQEGSIEEEVGD